MQQSPTRTRRRRGVIAVLVGLVALVGAACSDAVPSGAAAVVDGDVVQTSLLERIVDAQLEASGVDADSEEGAAQAAQLQRQILGALISFEITEDVADDLDVEVTEQDIEDEYDTQVGLAGGEEQLVSQVEDLGLTVEEWKDLLLGNIVRQQKISEAAGGDVEVTDREVREVFDEREAAGQYDTAEVSHILVGFGDGVAPGTEPTDEQVAAAEEEIAAVQERLDEGEAFEDVATEVSDDPGSAAQGGSLGNAPLTQYVPEFADAAREAEVGEVVGPVRTQFGFHLIRVDSRDETTFADVEDSIREELVAQQSGSAVEELLLAAVADADVTVQDRFGEWNPETGTVDAPGSPTDDQQTDGPANPAPGQPTEGGTPAPADTATEG